MKRLRPVPVWVCVMFVLSVFTAGTDAAFVTPSNTPTGAAAFTNWTRADVDTTYQQWRGPINGGAPALLGGGENFTTLFGLNQPDNDLFNPNGTATAQFLDADRNSTGFTAGLLVGGTHNIYSFFTSADWELLLPDYGYGSGETTLILQLEVDGNEIIVGPSTPNNPTAPNSVKVDGYDWVDHVELSRSGSTGGGFPTFAMTHWFRFELPTNEAGHVLEFDTFDPSFGSYTPSSIDPVSTDDLMYGHTTVTAIAIDTNVVTMSIPQGDLDGDGFVGISDLNIVLGNWNLNVSPGDINGDPSGDGFVGIEDLNVVLGNWNKGIPPGGIAVPEPGVLAVMGLTGPVLLRRGR
jgi:hypothetical protein